MICILSYISFDFNDPTTYLEPWNFSHYILAINYTSSQVNKSPNNTMIVDTTFSYTTDALLRYLGGLNYISAGLKVGDWTFLFSYFGREGLGIQAFDEGILLEIGRIYGSDVDTIYPGMIPGLNRSIVVRYILENNVNQLAISTKGSISYMSRPMNFTVGKGGMYLNVRFREFSGSGSVAFRSDFFVAKNPITVEPLDPNVEWLALVSGLVNIPSFKRMEYAVSFERSMHVSFYMDYTFKGFRFRLGYSPKLSVRGELTKNYAFLLSFNDTAKDISLAPENNLYAISEGTNVQIEGSALAYIYVDYVQDSTTSTQSFTYELPANVLLGIFYERALGRWNLSTHATYMEFGKLHVGVSGEYAFNRRYALEGKLGFSKSPFLDYAYVSLNLNIETKDVLLSFGINSMLPREAFRFVRSNLYEHFASLKDTRDVFFSMNFMASLRR